MDGVDVVAVAEERLDDLEPLWRALYDHQSRLAPHLRDRARPFDDAWAVRRSIEREWLRAEPLSFVVAAESGGRYVAYAFVRVRSGAGVAASWQVSDPLAELATLVVLPEWQRRGVGSALMDAVEARLRELGVHDLLIGVITTNTDAINFYERRGAAPFVTELIQRV